MADKQFLGDRVSELEDKTSLATTTKAGIITLANSITSGDTTHVPTSDAVYQAVQGAGVQWIVPKPYSEASINDDVFVTQINSVSSPSIDQGYSIIGRTLFFANTAVKDIWLKRSIFNINSETDIYNKISVIFNNYSNNPDIEYVNLTSNYVILQIKVANYNSLPAYYNSCKIMYTP